MTVVVPDPISLDLPPGDAGALEDLATDVAGAASSLGAVGSALGGASAPAWRSADASAAAAQIAVVAGLADELAAGTSAAATRLRAHHRLLADARRRIATLREEQDEDFRNAWIRLSAIEDPRLAAMIDGPERVAAIEELEATEAARRREHARLLEELADDAATTSRTLAGVSAIVGGAGRHGDDGRVVAHLAAELPGWGEAELRTRGAELALRLSDHGTGPDEINALARDSLVLAGSDVFARELLTGLGVEGVRWLIEALGSRLLGATSDVAVVLSAAFAAAVPTGRAGDPVRQVLTATYVGADGRSGSAGVAAVGLAAVMLAGGTSGPRAVRPETAAGWARQLMSAERAFGVPLGPGSVPIGWDRRAFDPAVLAFTVVAAAGDPAVAAELFGDQAIWDTALARLWSDGGQAMRDVVTLAGTEPGPAGRAAMRNGLEALGAGLSEAGDPEKWTVREETATAVAPALGVGVANHLSVAIQVLGAAVDGPVAGGTDDALRGLGYLTLDRDAAASVGAALVEWVRHQPPALDGTGAQVLPPAAAVPGAWFAVQEYGQRLAYAIHGFQAQDDAERAEAWWDCTIGLLAELPPGHWGVVAGLAEGYLAIFLDADGTWENGRDSGSSFSRGAATREALAELGPEDAAASRLLAGQVSASYDRAAASLGAPRPPTSPESDYTAPLVDALGDLVMYRAETLAKKGD